jgi:hypothetical protein
MCVNCHVGFGSLTQELKKPASLCQWKCCIGEVGEVFVTVTGVVAQTTLGEKVKLSEGVLTTFTVSMNETSVQPCAV